MLFTLIIFTLLWLLQTVFLQSFYRKMMISNVKKAYSTISTKINDENFLQTINSIAENNSLLIFLTDTEGNILFNADEHSGIYENSRKQDKEDSNPYFNSSRQKNWMLGMYRNLPQGYNDFLKQIKSSNGKPVGYIQKDNKSYVYGSLLQNSSYVNNEPMILYINSKLEAIGGTVTIIRTQLIWCTAASIILAFIIAFFFAKQFSIPIQALTKDAFTLAQGTFNLKFSKGFCSELDQISDALDKTSKDLQKLESSRKELLANISHDLRTPLTMIKGYAEMLSDFSWSDETKREQDLGVIIKEADRLSNLVNDILSYSQIQEANTVFENKQFNISKALDFVIGQFTPLCNQKGITIDKTVQQDLFVTADEKQLQRVFYNFIDNAISHTEDSKQIIVSLNAIATSKTQTKVHFEVQNFGKTISPELQDKIWDRYFTARQQRATGTHSGLGLAISKEILIKSNALYGVRSEEGKPTTFWFEI